MKHTDIGEVVADDDSFCSILLAVTQSDSEREREVVQIDDLFGAPTSVTVHEPIRVHIGWEVNCTSHPGIWLTPAEALALAELLTRAAGEVPASEGGS